MSKKKRMRKALLAGAALFGASKLGLLGGKTAAGIQGDKFAKAKKLMTTDKAFSPPKFKTAIGPRNKVTEGITKLKESDLPKFSLKKDGTGGTRNMKSIFVQPDGSIIKGTEKFKNKEVFSKTMKTRRGENTSLKNFLNKVILGPKTQLNKGKMVKARGGGMARMKPTKLY
tara:strand:+ start:327 stop:839 length:513 start_codon:yes stop_codon:yes gene_type:complete